ncbi:hypothetical protein M0805_004909 [Coniferiporia weirii]|nr:hypothetical protein M0805_004909 [Coniferiporia weirii]
MDNLGKATFCLLFPAVATTIWHSLGPIFREFFARKTTVLYDLPNVGTPRAGESRLKGTAVVCGGSFAGLWTARILSDHFEDVLVVEPEAWLETPEGRAAMYDEKGAELGSGRAHARPRVQQYNTAHALQPMSYKALKHLFPNLDEEVKKVDGRIGDADFNIHFSGGQIMQPPKDGQRTDDRLQNFFLSRDAYERLLRRLVMESSSRIRWLAGTVSGVNTPEEDTRSLSSVVIRLPDGSERTVPAAMVIDCTGTTQAGLKWLKRLGIKHDETSGLPLEDLRISYQTVQRTRTYRFYIPPEARAKLPLPGGYDNATWIYSCMPKFGTGSKSFLVDRIEGHRIRIMFGSWGDQALPDFSDIKDFFEDLTPDERVPDWFMTMLDILLEYQHLAEVSNSKYPTLSSIRYERAAYLPSNFIAIGDSVMQVNPTFAQGCSKACVGAITLDSMLRSRPMVNSTSIPLGFSRQFFKELTLKTASAWDGTKPVDYLFQTTIPVKGEKLSDGWVKGRVVFTIMLLARTDKRVDSTLFNVINFLAPPTDLIHPVIVAKVLLFWTRQRLGLA